MNTKALVDVLRHARESGIRKNAGGLEWMRSNTGWWVETDKNTYEDLLKILREESDLIEFNEKMMNTSKGGSHRVTYENLAKSLLCRTLKVGEEQTVIELGKYIKLEFTPALNILALSGIQVDEKIDLCSEISLVPFEFIPDCIMKDLYKATDSMFNDTRNLLTIGFNYGTPKSALIKRIEIKPKFHETFDGKDAEFREYLRSDKLSMESLRDTEEFSQVYNCLSLVGNSAPIALSFWTVIEEWVPCSNMFQHFSVSGIERAISNASAYKLTPKDCKDFSDYIKKYFELPNNIRELLRTSLQRLNLFRRRGSLVDKAIDLGIALEVLLLHDGGPDVPISLPFRLRGAWLLGQDAKTRSNYLRLFKDIYLCRCEAVHSGKFNNKFIKKLSLPIHELFKKGDEFCVSIIKWITEQKRFPDWERLLVGDVMISEQKGESNKIS